MQVATVPLSKSFLFEQSNQPAARVEASPLDLTASDGTGLTLISLVARVVVEDPLAFTELHLTFQNPEPRRIEGRFRIALPSNASISRFAMRIGSQWQEGEVVERQAARRAYEDFLHRRQDPALLEHEAGNEFSARVFPIEANATKELIVSYSHELVRPGEMYRLPLVGLPTLGNLEIRALVGKSGPQGMASSLGGTSSSQQVVEVRKTGWKPDADFEVFPPQSGRAGLRHGNLALLRVQPVLPTEPDEIGSLLVLLDTSASRALGHARQLELLSTLIRGLAQGAGAATPVMVACFDQGVDVSFEGGAGDFTKAAAPRLAERPALGASDLAGALRWAAKREGKSYDRLLVITDGVATQGDTEPEKLLEAAKGVGGAGIKRLDVLSVGGLRDDAALKRLVTAGLDRDGTVSDGDLAPPEIAARLTRATRSGIKVEVPGASWVWPSKLDAMQPGDAALVYADLAESKPVQVLLDGKSQGGELKLDPVERPLLERAWVKARVEKLEEQRARADDADVREGLKKQVIDLSVKHRVLSPHTALLVLETEADYARFNIDRRALADILSVGPGGLEVLSRTNAAPQPVAQPVTTPPANKVPAEMPKPAPRPSTGAAMPAAKSAQREESLSLDDTFAEGAEEPAMAAAPELEASMDLSAMDMPAPAPAAEASIDFDAAPPPPTQASGAMPSPAFAPAPAPMRAMAMPEPTMAAPQSAERSRSAGPSGLRRMVDAVSDAISSIMPSAPPSAPPPPAPPPPPPSVQARLSSPVANMPAPPIPGSLPSQPAPLSQTASWTGLFREVMELVLSGKKAEALARARTWLRDAPGDVLALVALGEAAEAAGDRVLAARAYGSIIDLFPSRADLRRFAGERLERLTEAAALEAAIDTYRKAVESRPDHPSSHRLLGMALLRAGRVAEAFEAIAVGQARQYPPKFPGVDRILAEDLGLCAAAWIRAEPAKRDEVLSRLSRAGCRLEDKPSVRFVLVWETDANDVDFHIHDARGGHAYFRERQLPSGGELYADITQGYGPECFTIRTAPGARAYPYRLQAHYYSRGPMGYGMGKLQILEHDGQGNFAFEERPYVVMQDGAYVDLGVVNGPLGGKP